VSNRGAGIPVAFGSEVYYGHTDHWEVAELSPGDGPADADQIAERYFAYIEAKLSE